MGINAVSRTGQFGIAMNTLDMQDRIIAAGGPIRVQEAEYRVLTFNRQLQEMLGDVLLRTAGKSVEVKIELRLDSRNFADLPDLLTVGIFQDFFERGRYRERPFLIAYQVTVLLVNWRDAEVGDFVRQQAIEAQPDKIIVELWDNWQMDGFLFERHGLGWERVR